MLKLKDLRPGSYFVYAQSIKDITPEVSLSIFRLVTVQSSEFCKGIENISDGSIVIIDRARELENEIYKVSL